MNPEGKKRFTEMKTAMLLHAPFFASLMLDMMELKLGKFPGLDTAGTNGKTIWFDEDYLAKLTLPEAVAACCHEIGHAMWMHMDRGRRYMDTGFDGKPFLPMLYNIAADYVINDMLIRCNVGSVKKEWLHSPKYNSHMLVDDVYRDLYKQLPPPPPGGGGGSDPGEGNPAPEGSNGGIPSREGFKGLKPQDTHVFEPSNVNEAEMKRAVQSATNQAKAMGKMPADLERFVENLMDAKINWREQLRQMVLRAVGRDARTWRTPHRRRLVIQGMYLPSYVGTKTGTVVFAVDTSGSMGQREFDAGMSELNDIFSMCRPEKVHVLSCDARVHTHTEYSNVSDMHGNMPKMKGGGGTAFEPVFDWVHDNFVEPQVLIYFTDMYGSFPREAPSYPVIWVSTTDVVGPFGSTVKVDLTGEHQ
jgi:predicted metal-dependent peptidase